MKTKTLALGLLLSLGLISFTFAQNTTGLDQDPQTTNSSSIETVTTTDATEDSFTTTTSDPFNDNLQAQITAEKEFNEAFDKHEKVFGGMFLIALLMPLLMVGIGIACLIFWIMMLIDVIQRQEKDKALWVIVIVLGNTIGAIVYYFAARKPRLVATQTTQGPVVAPTPPTQIPPVTPTPM